MGHLFGTQLPIIQAPMAGVQGVRLAVAVCNAGGLGSLPCAMLSPEGLYKGLKSLSESVKTAYNVNFFAHRPSGSDLELEKKWRGALLKYYTEFGIDQTAISEGPSRLPFSVESADILSEFKPPVVSFHFGLPAPNLLAKIKRWGAVIVSTATTVEEAIWLEANGADAIVAQGLEAGGHRGHFLDMNMDKQMGTMALVPQVVDAVKLPVIAAGGIADARGVRAAIMLGASAVQVGTAYLLCHETEISTAHRESLRKSASGDTALTNLFSGRPARGIVNRIMRELGPMSDSAPAFPFASSALAPLREKAESLGLTDFTPLWAGQNMSGCLPVDAADLTRTLAANSI